MKEWFREWIRYMSVPKPYPREFSLSRLFIYTDDIIKENGVDEYSSVFSHWQNTMNWYDVIFIDIDGKDAYWKYREVMRILKNESDIEPSMVYFSGRGFHIYLWFDGFVFKDYRSAVRRFMNASGLNKYADNHVVGDTRRMARIPHTYNSKSGLWTMKVSSEWSWVEIKGRSKIRNEYSGKWIKQNEIRNLLSEFDFGESNFEWKVDGIRNGHSIVNDDVYNNFPPCITQWINELKTTGELDHIQRFNLGLFLLHVWGYEKTFNFFKDYANDFKPNYTEYQLKYMYRRRLKMYKCSRIEEFGLCPMRKKECKYRPTLNAYLKWND